MAAAPLARVGGAGGAARAAREGERPLAFLSVTKGFRAGLLAATDRRLVFLARIFGEEWLEWPHDLITDVRATTGPLGGRRLLVSIGDGRSGSARAGDATSSASSTRSARSSAAARTSRLAPERYVVK